VRLIPSKRPLDIEWALTGEKVWILQARPFIGP
jgi:phosphoenolpyruvate synthase/pyruvate phosphate dikinase